MAQETETTERGWNIKRGLKWTAVNIVIGYFAAVLGVFILFPMMLPVHFDMERAENWHGAYSMKRAIYCLEVDWNSLTKMQARIGACTFLAFTAWATYAPKGKYGFASTLAIIFFLSFPLWAMIVHFSDLMVNWQGEYPDPIRLMILISPPIFVSLILSLIRAGKMKTI